jgi:hypothetical protein
MVSRQHTTTALVGSASSPLTAAAELPLDPVDQGQPGRGRGVAEQVTGPDQPAGGHRRVAPRLQHLQGDQRGHPGGGLVVAPAAVQPEGPLAGADGRRRIPQPPGRGRQPLQGLGGLLLPEGLLERRPGLLPRPLGEGLAAAVQQLAGHIGQCYGGLACRRTRGVGPGRRGWVVELGGGAPGMGAGTDVAGRGAS